MKSEEYIYENTKFGFSHRYSLALLITLPEQPLGLSFTFCGLSAVVVAWLHSGCLTQ